MATKPTRVEVNCETGEQSVIELTNAEIAQMEADAAVYAEQKAAADAAAAAAAAAKASGIAKLLALGLTEAEANALVK
jgi:type IV secretory pathway VirB9-like protein